MPDPVVEPVADPAAAAAAAAVAPDPAADPKPAAAPYPVADPKPAAAPEGDKAPPKDLLDTGEGDGAPSPADADLLSGDGDAVDDTVPDEYSVDHLEALPGLDDEKLAAFMGGAKEAGLTQSQFDFVLTRGAELVSETTESLNSGYHDRIASWREAAAADTTIGGDKLDQSLANASGVLRQFADAEFRALLGSPTEKNPEGLGIGNHPASLRFLNRIAAAVGEPSPIEGDGRGGTPTDAERLARMYPSMFEKPKT